MSSDPLARVPRGRRDGDGGNNPDWKIVLPVPADAPPAPRRHRDLGKPTTVWLYTDAEGRTLGYIHRYDAGKDSKEFGDSPSGAPSLAAWSVALGELACSKASRRAMKIAERPSAPVVVAWKEKRPATPAARLLAAFAAVTNPNGAKSADKADWYAAAGPCGYGVARR